MFANSGGAQSLNRVKVFDIYDNNVLVRPKLLKWCFALKFRGCSLKKPLLIHIWFINCVKVKSNPSFNSIPRIQYQVLDLGQAGNFHNLLEIPCCNFNLYVLPKPRSFCHISPPPGHQSCTAQVTKVKIFKDFLQNFRWNHLIGVFLHLHFVTFLVKRIKQK